MYSLIRRLLFLLDAEDAHEFTVAQITRLQQIPLILQAIAAIYRVPSRPRTLWGIEFRSPIGIAAGFDKNAVMMPFLAALGFGFLEVGTVTLHPQSGNPKPRLFRDTHHRALINRLGFNNDGADLVAERLQSFQRHVPVFVNIGKNRDVPLDRAADSYAQCYLRVARWADGCVLNVSSPNTPGLRELQRPEHLERVLALVRTLREEMPHGGPILVKIAPDLDRSQIDEICAVCTRLADGMVCTNTTATPEGGLSGRPLFDGSTEVLREVRGRVGADFPLIGVGGIFTADDVRAKFDAGADLVQVYTGMIYEGPSLPSRLAGEVADRGARSAERGQP
jgi:dihydroorotate dehydrogenase